MFSLSSPYTPSGDQPRAIEKLSAGISAGLKNQTLLGITGSGKTFTMAHVIQHLQKPALIISHNKTLAGQLYQEFRDFFPSNAVSYFVSYYDYYQPEAYIPSSDTYIEKESSINSLIDKLRLQATANILTRRDVVVVASVSCIYNLGSPDEYGRSILDIRRGSALNMLDISRRLVELQYNRGEFELSRGSFRVRGTHVDIYPAYEDFAYRISSDPNGIIATIARINPTDGTTLEIPEQDQSGIVIYPAKHYIADKQSIIDAQERIRTDLHAECAALRSAGRIAEADRLLRKVTYDMELITEVGYVNGIENYSRYFDGRKPGDPPFTLIDYFRKAYGDDFIVFVDESHMTIPQVRGMFHGDRSRKQTLIDFGFRMRAALDNRPMQFDEFYAAASQFVYVSATPNPWEVDLSRHDALTSGFTEHSGVVEQIIRPTGILDPEVIVRPATNEIPDLLQEIHERTQRGERVLVTTLTKKTAEDLKYYLDEKKVKAAYLHSDVHTLERSDILDGLRNNEFDVLIGVNLLREGLDLPEVTLVAILDADREGFLRSRTSLVQTMGRAARNVLGRVILYADTITDSMQSAMDEIGRRRAIQIAYNTAHHITPRTIIKPVRSKIVEKEDPIVDFIHRDSDELPSNKELSSIDGNRMTPYDTKKMIKKLESEMRRAAENLQFEVAIRIRDKIRELKG
ncbi:MAG: hypothetical protein RIQ54_430 [Candidatus Parcubacteria bacterium]|jgi:excinuclease ABC subunit B